MDEVQESLACPCCRREEGLSLQWPQTMTERNETSVTMPLLSTALNAASTVNLVNSQFRESSENVAMVINCL